jgi:LPS-assembly protein
VRRNEFIFSLIAAVIVSLTVSPLWGFQKELDGPVQIEADSIAYNGDEDSFGAVGNVIITFTGGWLKADSVLYRRPDNIAHAQGNVKIKSDDDILEGQKVSFNINSKTGVVGEGELFIAENNVHIRGERIEKKSEANYRLEKGYFTTCNGSCPDWSISGREVDVAVDGYGVIRDGRFLVRNVPVLYIPWLIFPAKTTRQTGLLFPHFSYSRDNNGLDIEVPFYWAFSESADATFFQRYIEKRGFKEGVELRYFLNPDTSGLFYADFIRDNKQAVETAGVQSRNWQDGKDRWSYYFNHGGTLSNGVKVRADIKRVSDHWYFRDFSSYNYYSENFASPGGEGFKRISFVGDQSLGYLDSTVQATKDWSNYNLTVLARYTDDLSASDNSLTMQKYPEAVFTGFRRTLFNSPLQMEFSGRYDYFYSSESQKGHLGEFSPKLFLPFKLGRYLNMTPWAGYRADLWERTDGLADTEDKRDHRGLFSMGATMSSEVSRVYHTGGESVDKLRHAIRPEIEYTYAPVSEKNNIPIFLDQPAEFHGLRYGFVSYLTARMKAKDGQQASYREIMRLKVSQGFDIHEARRDVSGPQAANRPFGNVDVELDTSPVRYVSLSSRNTWDVKSGGILKNDYDVTVSDNRGDSISAGYRYTRDTLEEVNLSVGAALSSSLYASYVLRKNRLDNRTVESTIGMKYRRQCWLVEISIADLYNDRNVMVYLSLLGLGGRN